MNWLVKEITEPFISTTGEKIILIPGGFKPPTLGHFHIVNEMAKKNEIDKVIVLIGHKIRDGITKEQSLEIWNIYKSHLPSKVTIITSDKISPVGDVISIIKNNPQNFYYPVVGIRGEEDEGDLKRFDYLKDKYTNYKPIIFNSDLNISGTKARRALLDGDFEIFKNFIPSELTEVDKMKVWDILNNNLNEYIKPAKKEDVDLKELKMGIEVEMEHTTDPKKAEIIALQHLAEDPKYYTKLVSLKLEENKQVGILYHYTSVDGLKGILQSNSIKASEEIYMGNYLYYISFTRNKNFHKKRSKFGVKTEYRITLDGDKLSNKYKIQPFAYIPGWDYADNWEYDWLEDEDEQTRRDFFNTTGDYDEQEERIFFKDKNNLISNIKNYIIKIDKVSDLKENINENATYSSGIDYKQIINEICEYLIKKYDFPLILPNIEYIDGDTENAKTIFTKTGHYNPTTKTITLYTEGRHPRDIVSTFCHEFQHHIQNMEGRLTNINGQNTMEDDYLDKIEREAYEEGGILFRNWKDSVKNSSNTQEYTDLLTQQLAEALIPQSPLEKSLRIKYNDILEKLIIFEKNNHIEVNQIRINNQHKNQGYGTKIMNDIIEHANKTLKVITLTPTNDFGSDELRLIEFYKRLGFVKNKNNREYLDTYIKYPKYI
jgi:ribosomal protein S18 acetylase RimI-like enzyme